MSTPRTASKGIKITVGVLAGLVAAVAVLIVITTVVESGPKDYEFIEDGGNYDYSQISVPAEYSDDEYSKILDEVRDDRWKDEGAYHVQIICAADEKSVAEARGGIGAKGNAQTGTEGDEWIIDDRASTGESACA